MRCSPVTPTRQVIQQAARYCYKTEGALQSSGSCEGLCFTAARAGHERCAVTSLIVNGPLSPPLFCDDPASLPGPKTQCNQSAEAANPVLPPVPFLDGKKIRAWYNPTALAFLGDSIWEVCTSHSPYQAHSSRGISTTYAQVSFLLCVPPKAFRPAGRGHTVWYG